MLKFEQCDTKINFDACSKGDAEKKRGMSDVNIFFWEFDLYLISNKIKLTLAM